jgi:hypothetical protein
MSNTLTVTLTEFKVRGSDHVSCGFFAQDDVDSSVYRAASTWEGFKAQFPTRESILNHLSGVSVFFGLSGSYSVQNGEIVMVADQEEDPDAEEPMYDAVYFEGEDGLY